MALCRLVTFDPPPGLDQKVRFQLAIDPIDVLMVPVMSLDFAHVQKAQSKTPGPVRLGQPFQQVCDELILSIALRAVAKTGLADTKARQASAMLTPFVATAFSANSRHWAGRVIFFQGLP